MGGQFLRCSKPPPRGPALSLRQVQGGRLPPLSGAAPVSLTGWTRLISTGSQGPGWGSAAPPEPKGPGRAVSYRPLGTVLSREAERRCDCRPALGHALLTLHSTTAHGKRRGPPESPGGRHAEPGPLFPIGHQPRPRALPSGLAQGSPLPPRSRAEASPPSPQRETLPGRSPRVPHVSRCYP